MPCPLWLNVLWKASVSLKSWGHYDLSSAYPKPSSASTVGRIQAPGQGPWSVWMTPLVLAHSWRSMEPGIYLKAGTVECENVLQTPKRFITRQRSNPRVYELSFKHGSHLLLTPPRRGQDRCIHLLWASPLKVGQGAQRLRVSHSQGGIKLGGKQPRARSWARGSEPRSEAQRKAQTSPPPSRRTRHLSPGTGMCRGSQVHCTALPR